MIRISTRGRYALRAMVDLALHQEEGLVARRTIAARQDISVDYVAQLFRQLRIAGLVEGVKGPGGGYALRRSPEDILVGDIVRAMEGPIAPVQCIIRDREDVCDRIKLCATHVLWEDLADVISGFLDSITLADLCAETRQLRQENEENA